MNDGARPDLPLKLVLRVIGHCGRESGAFLGCLAEGLGEASGPTTRRLTSKAHLAALAKSVRGPWTQQLAKEKGSLERPMMAISLARAVVPGGSVGALFPAPLAHQRGASAKGWRVENVSAMWVACSSETLFCSALQNAELWAAQVLRGAARIGSGGSGLCTDGVLSVCAGLHGCPCAHRRGGLPRFT